MKLSERERRELDLSMRLNQTQEELQSVKDQRDLAEKMFLQKRFLHFNTYRHTDRTASNFTLFEPSPEAFAEQEQSSGLSLFRSIRRIHPHWNHD